MRLPPSRADPGRAASAVPLTDRRAKPLTTLADGVAREGAAADPPPWRHGEPFLRSIAGSAADRFRRHRARSRRPLDTRRRRGVWV